ncbi:sodium/hydrogen exchanger [Gluconacetobacter diazotrophicus PA1 5]|uniref:Putative glutathione-regulated potassium-efflux system protein kefB n=1 Tax=Gluconacetobacter diazotrophicus (strain ATCC 49037 / DSM 5601 / CCUG 37298 / CIP 103539 / LMG 7603 / PAl5) TaxID=272568 RepID=A9HBP8_GLUDA|nr:cation:proton antiporter [Gluconacetobacter diazotrophicus]ACI50905.1 sodium/hydrogen exchanger [Gluconacetobacter diazotrophicus PA1 5]TWB08641.1 transporter (CPA2 family) [Gluconacetobacter diazotrophicus]CAP54841.1 putative glutathione-regulated potassium-efflux system protein kefB [Gluconacetobacter diazotrophicus PA1 5]
MVLGVIADFALFVAVPWLTWRLLGRRIPIAVLPIVVGILLAVTRWPVGRLGVPSATGDMVGWVAVLILAFTAGLEMWQHPGEDPSVAPVPATSLRRLLTSALVALALPFGIGTLLVHTVLMPLPDWQPPDGHGWIGAMAIGLCIAVSALPVLIGIVRELAPAERAVGQLALRLAVVDDMALWTGLAVLQFAADGAGALHGWHRTQFLAALILGVMVAISGWTTRRVRNPPLWLIWAVLPLWLAAGSWASMQLGLHELIGAYAAGALMPPRWVRRLPVEQAGTLALIWLAPLFFGHSGMHIDGRALTFPSVLASLLLVVVSIASKLGAVLAYPPAPGLRGRRALAAGALLQCKGLMEIVAATILHQRGMVSNFAYASLMLLAVISTVLTGPMFRLFNGGTSRE